MAKKGQKFQKYSMEIKAEAIRLKEEGYSYKQIADKQLPIQVAFFSTKWQNNAIMNK
ncbi:MULTISPECIES: hypothetical protein [Bacillaceae]|uniref:hypothetical protein n=1 Tax=Bacillaceae TaxID=186817 RepID=UPI00041403E0|nr:MULTISPECIES: hypothetical protein [Bacillaceae]SFC82550.1 hypothetical protein SAMN02799633_01830 [Bacillus sp. UNCCL81]